jgi:hypothetical protein
VLYEYAPTNEMVIPDCQDNGIGTDFAGEPMSWIHCSALEQRMKTDVTNPVGLVASDTFP